MILKKVVRLFAWLIAGPALVYMMYNLYIAINANGLGIIIGNVGNAAQAGVIVLYLIGIFLSTQNEILGGVVTFFSPLIYIAIFSYLTSSLYFYNILIMMLLVGGIFFLFTAESPG